VLLDGLNRNLPAKYRVALSAIRAVLATMNVRVAIRAILPDIREDGFQMTSRAVNLGMHSA
jgi:hypothetical protein